MANEIDWFKKPFTIEFGYDGGFADDYCDPPSVTIGDRDGFIVVEILEDPIPLVDTPAFDDDHWKAGPNAELMLQLLNEHWSHTGDE